MTQEKTTAVAVQDRSGLTALTGTLDERMRAFDQIAANVATLQLNGWDTAQKAKAACWLADGAGMHPAIFMQNNYSMIMKGRLVIEPKWQFLVAMLESRIPGFIFKVIEENEKRAIVEMSDGRNTHKVEYTLEDARRQGLLSRDNAWAANTREMCLKQAIKRCAWRFPAALMDLPSGDYSEIEVEQENGQPTTPAQAIDEAVNRATKPQAEDVPFEEMPQSDTAASTPPQDAASPAGGVNGGPGTSGPAVRSGGAPGEAPDPGSPPPPKQSPRQRLYATLVKWYGGALSKDDVAKKASFIYNEMIRERTGNDPQVSFKPGEIGPVEAEQLTAYLEARIAAKAQSGGKAPSPFTVNVNAPPEQDDAPPAETPAPEHSPSVARGRSDAYEELHVTIGRARQLFPGRNFLVENPPGSSKFWFTDQITFSQAGEKTVLKLMEGGQVVVPYEKIDQLNRILAAACDEKERGGR